MARKTNIFLAIGLVLVAILAGCSDKASYPPYPVSVYIEQTGDFLDGQSFNSANFKVTVRYFDGSEKEYSNAGLVLSGNDGLVNAGDTVSINVGTDINGKPVKSGDIAIKVFKFDHIEVVASKTEYAYVKAAAEGTAEETVAKETGVKPALGDFVVNAYYNGAADPIVLSPSDYDVDPVVLTEDLTQKEFDDATELAGAYTVTVSDSISKVSEGESNLGTSATVSVTLTKEAKPVTPMTVTDIVSFRPSLTTFAIPAYDYTEIDLPAIDPTKVGFDITATGDGAKNTALASELTGVTLEYVNKDGKPFDDNFESLDLTVEENRKDVYMQATWNEKVIGPTAVTVAPASISAEVGKEYQKAGTSSDSGYEIAAGTAIADVNKDAFRVYLAIGEESSKVKELLDSNDQNLKFYFVASASDNTPTEEQKVGESGSAYMQIEYNGVVLASPITFSVVAEKVTYTSPDVEFATAPIFKQKYSAGETPTVAITDLKSVTVTDNKGNVVVYSADDEETEFGTWISVVGVYSDAEGEEALTEAEDLSDVDTVYAKISYNSGTAFVIVPVETVEPTVTSIDLVVAYTYKLHDAETPMLDSPIEWTITATSETGTFAVDPESADLVIWVDNEEVSELPAILSKENLGKKVGVTYKGIDSGSGTAVTLPAADGVKGYYEIADLGFEFADTATTEFFIGKAFTATATDYAIADGSFDYVYANADEVESVEEDDKPQIKSVSVPSKYQLIAETGNEVTIVVTYLDKTGDVIEADPATFEFNGRSWYGIDGDVLAITVGEVVIDSTLSSAPDELKAGDPPHEITTDMLNLIGYGTPEAATITAVKASGEGSATISEISGGVSIRMQTDVVVKITVTYASDEGEISTDLYVKGV